MGREPKETPGKKMCVWGGGGDLETGKISLMLTHGGSPQKPQKQRGGGRKQSKTGKSPPVMALKLL